MTERKSVKIPQIPFDLIVDVKLASQTDFGPYRQVVFVILFYLINEGLLQCDLYLQDGGL